MGAAGFSTADGPSLNAVATLPEAPRESRKKRKAQQHPLAPAAASSTQALPAAAPDGPSVCPRRSWTHSCRSGASSSIRHFLGSHIFMPVLVLLSLYK